MTAKARNSLIEIQHSPIIIECQTLSLLMLFFVKTLLQVSANLLVAMNRKIYLSPTSRPRTNLSHINLIILASLIPGKTE
jgi:hypothetical protein